MVFKVQTCLKWGAALVGLITWHAHALQITRVTPQGQVAQAQQVVVRFDDSAVNFGDPGAPAPVVVNCSDPRAARGTGRWISDREWAFDFDTELPPGVNCTVVPLASLRSPKGQALTPAPGRTPYRFSTGGPSVQQVHPDTDQPIDEEQYFTLELNGAATLQSLRERVWCAVEGLGERVPVQLVEGATRAALLKSHRLDKAAAADPLSIATLACARRLTPGTKVQLVFGKGVSTPGGAASTTEKRFNFRVHEPFTASFSCERENAQAACLPIRSLKLLFNAPVARKLAGAIRLNSSAGSLQPVFDAQDADGDAVVHSVGFAPLFAEQTSYTLELPRDFRDASGRPLRNAASFPMKVATGAMPPLVKFAASPFGIVERLAEPGARPGDPAVLPVTLRKVEGALQVQAASAGAVADLQPRSDADIIGWYQKVLRYDHDAVPRKLAAADVKGPLPRVIDPRERQDVQTRMLSLLAGHPGVRTLDLPQSAGGDPRPFEVVGIPLSPGFHVVEIASRRLGASLLDERHGPQRTMFVRTAVLVTNLGVHFKLGRENAQAWITSLDKGAPVPGAVVQVSDCRGKLLATATANAQGLAAFSGLSSEPPRCNDLDSGSAYFVSARTTAADGVQDLAFTWSDWHKGIEPWRFNVPTSSEPVADERVHTVLDRTLFRAGDTVSMKHLLRSETRGGFGLPARQPATLEISHLGSGQRYTQPLSWRTTATGGLSASSSFALPPTARLGVYTVHLKGPRPGGDGTQETSIASGQFRVEAFRLPVLEGRVAPTAKGPLIKAASIPAEVQVNYVAGGAAVNLPVRVSALTRTRELSFGDYEAFNFSPPQRARPEASGSGHAEEESTSSQDQRVVADKLPLTLDRNGTGKLTLADLPVVRQPQDLLLEASYADPNGEVQTLRSVTALWPAGVIAGLRTEGWVSTQQKVSLQAVALDLSGKPAADVPLEVRALARIVTTSRKRMVGGFYTYDNRTEVKDLGTVCSGRSDARGLLLCEARLAEPGEVELIVTARDTAGNSFQAASSVYVTRQGELWFGGENHDRMDVLPEKKSYQPGETARFQVRMPFRFATALVSVEREGIIDSRLVQLNGQDPTIDLKVREDWGPNVYVSVLALRGRLREVPWYSFFTWGFKAPREWWTSFWYEGREYVAPTSLVDLSKPTFRLGLAEIRVGTRAHQLDVSVKADRESYPVRSSARVTVSVKLPNGQPAAHAEVALAAVDQALLELMPNTSWNVLDAMLQRRAWGVETATAQMEIIGRRHYGRKAAPAGGGGGRSNTRELLDTLLLWQPALQLDAQGQAVVTVPLNDALTTFQIVAVADAGTGLFGTGQTRIRSTQDLQIINGLAPLVREDDRFVAQFTLRNTTRAAMKVQVTARATLLQPEPQTVDLPAGEARVVSWNVIAPAPLAQSRFESILWEIEAKDTTGGARDALKAGQRILPAVPLTVQQATLVQLGTSLSLDVRPPPGALLANGVPRGGLKVSLQPGLGDGLQGVRDWFGAYPFACLEQKASRAIGLREAKAWQAVLAQLPGYLDVDGLPGYFPPHEGEASRGSDTLGAYLLAAAHEAGSLNPALALPEEARAPLERALVAFVEGRLQRDTWSPRSGQGGDLEVRKLAAIEALSRHGKARARMLESIAITPQQWPTHALIDWLGILQRVSDVPRREQRLAEVTQILRARLSFQGGRAVFSTEKDDHWWWLMANGDTNAARLMLAVMDDPAWKDDLGRLASGLIARQTRGAWQTTTANLWGSLALERFAARFESVPVRGSTRASVGAATANVDWSRTPQGLAAQLLPWSGTANAPAASAAPLTVAHQGSGRPWLTLQALAAVPLREPVSAGYQLRRTVTPVEQADKALPPGSYTRGDVLRITLEINASADMSWVALTDPVPGGATILGGGLGRDSQIATRGEKPAAGAAWPAWEERGQDALRSYFAYLPKGLTRIEYTVRLNNAGDFSLPPSRVEAMYAPEVFGATPNARVRVEAVK